MREVFSGQTDSTRLNVSTSTVLENEWKLTSVGAPSGMNAESSI